MSYEFSMGIDREIVLKNSWAWSIQGFVNLFTFSKVAVLQKNHSKLQMIAVELKRLSGLKNLNSLH